MQRQKNMSRVLGLEKFSRENITKTDLMMAFSRIQSCKDLAFFFPISEALFL